MGVKERHHFIRNDLRASQLEALETPPEAFEINADHGIDVVTGHLVSRIRMLAGVLRPHP
jgi:gluconate kinase